MFELIVGVISIHTSDTQSPSNTAHFFWVPRMLMFWMVMLHTWRLSVENMRQRYTKGFLKNQIFPRLWINITFEPFDRFSWGNILENTGRGWGGKFFRFWVFGETIQTFGPKMM